MNSDTSYLLQATLVMFLVTYFLRGFVFAAFGGSHTPPKVILYIGTVIGPAVIAALIVYCFRNTVIASAPYGIPEATAAVTCIALHLWKRNPLLSIIISTVVYMFLVQNIHS